MKFIKYISSMDSYTFIWLMFLVVFTVVAPIVSLHDMTSNGECFKPQEELIPYWAYIIAIVVWNIFWVIILLCFTAIISLLAKIGEYIYKSNLKD